MLWNPEIPQTIAMKDIMPDVRKGGAPPESPGRAQGPEAAAKKRRRKGVYCLLFFLWLLVGLVLFHKMWEGRHEIAGDAAREEGERRIWHFVNTEE